MVDRDALAELIEEGRLRHASSEEIAEAILVRLEDPVWAKAMSHPTRAAILRALREHGPMSPVRAAELVGEASLGTLSYHFRMLNQLGLIALSDTIPRRGAVEHIYALTQSAPEDGATR